MSQPRRRVVRQQTEYQKFVRHLRSMREYEKLTQEEVANGLRLSRSQYTSLENGHSMMSVDLLCSLAKFYKLSVGEFVTGVI